MKMSDVFALPIDPEMVEPSDIYNYLKKNVSIDIADYHAAHAINMHDYLVDALRDALNMLISIYDDDEIRIASKKHVTLAKMQPLSDALKNAKGE